MEFFELSMHAERNREREKVKGHGSAEVTVTGHTATATSGLCHYKRLEEKKKKKKTRNTVGNVAFNIGFFFLQMRKQGLITK